MLSTVLSSERAIQVDIAIMRAFVKFRRALAGHRDLAQKFERLEGRVNMHETDIRFLQHDVKGLKEKPIDIPMFRVRGFGRDQR